MQPLATDLASSVCPSVGNNPNPAKIAERIEMPFGLWTWVCPRNDILGCVPISTGDGTILGACHAPLKSIGRKYGDLQIND